MADALRMGDVVELQASNDGPGTLAGYFARFGEQTEINNPAEGHFLETIAPGAFTKTLSDRGYDPTTGLLRAGGQHVPVLFHHGLDSAIGMRPLGVPSMIRQDGQGVYGEVPLDDTSYNRDLAASLKSGALGQSFRFRPVTARDVWTRSGELPQVTRGEVGLKEFGPTPIPAYGGSTAGLRSGDVPDLRASDGSISLTRFLLDSDQDPELIALMPELQRAGAVLSNENLALIDQAIVHLQKVHANHMKNRSEDLGPAHADRLANLRALQLARLTA